MCTSAICAQVLWREQLHDVHLFTAPDDDQPSGNNFVPGCAVRLVDAFLSVESYAVRWPKMPYRELVATSVKHPFLKSRWLLDTKAYRQHLDKRNNVIMNADKTAPPVRACSVRRHALCRPRPTLPWRALANDFLMLREPCVFRTESKALLSDATFLSCHWPDLLLRRSLLKDMAKAIRRSSIKVSLEIRSPCLRLILEAC